MPRLTHFEEYRDRYPDYALELSRWIESHEG